MNTKKSTTLHGTLLYPLIVGGCAMILHNGNVIRTSLVVAVHKSTARELRFETLNTNYTLLLNPAPHAAACFFPTRMAA